MSATTTNAKRTVYPTKAYGHPGGYARHLARLAMARRLVAGAGIGALIWAYWVLGGLTGAPSSHLTLIISVFVGIVICATGLHSATKRYRKASIGARTERRVAKVIGHCGAGVVLNGALIGRGGDADHIVLGPPLAVIETKTGYGQVRVDQDRLLAGNRQIPGDPIAQVLRQARTLGQKANAYATPIVCVPDMTNAPFVTKRVTVCSLADLVNVLAAVPPVLDGAAARQLGHELWTNQHT
jgi:hypothetical protein